MEYGIPWDAFKYRSKAGCFLAGVKMDKDMETKVDMTHPGEFYFTAGRLVEILKSMPPDLPVLTSGYKSGPAG